MPIACLPNSLINLLTTSSSTYFSTILSNTFKWGSTKPLPPIDRLEELTNILAKINKEEENNKLFTTVGDDNSLPNNHLYSELVSLWRSIAIAHTDKRLSLKDCNRVSQIVNNNTKIIPGFGKLWNIYQCIKIISGSNFNSTSPESDGTLAAIYFLSVGACLNINEKSTMYGDNNTSWELSNVANAMISLIKPQSYVSSNLAKDYLNWFCNKDLLLPPSNSIKKSYTLALWVLCKRNLPNNGINPSSEALKSCYQIIKQLCPNLKVFCKRMERKKEIWLHIFESNDEDMLSDQIQHPVLIDDENITTGSGNIRSSLLRPHHNYQPIDILNSDYISNQFSSLENTDTDMKRLIDIEKNLINILQIPKISDLKLFQLKISASPNGEYLEKVSERLDVIIQLLKIIHYNPLQENVVVSDDISMPISTERIILQRHLTLNCQFKTPLMSTFEINSTFAIWGTKNYASMPLTKINNEKINTKFMLISGRVDDYNYEMEELVKRKVFNRKATVLFDVKRSLLALKLLNYIEDEEIFMKHLHRNFDEFTKPVPDILPNEKAGMSSIKVADMTRNLYLFIKEIKSNQLDVETTKDEKILQNIPVENPVELISNSRLNSKGLSNLPAWMTNGLDPNQLDEKQVSENQIKKNTIKVNDKINTNIDSRKCIGKDGSNSPKKINKEEMDNENPVELISNSRLNSKGLSNLPAWMTNGLDPNQLDEKPVAEIVVKDASVIKDNMKTASQFLNSLEVTSSSSPTQGITTGLGMDKYGEISDITLEAVKLKEGEGYESSNPPKKRNKEELDNEKPFELISNSRLNSKGLSNLPAWMTNGLDPNQLDEESTSDNLDINKRRKTEFQFHSISSILISLIIDSTSKNLLQSEINIIKNLILESLNDDKIKENLKTEKLKSSLSILINAIVDKDDNSHPYLSLLN
jgi:hypothetical protein